MILQIVFIILAVALSYVILYPCKIAAERNAKKKEGMAPALKEIHKKYGINQLGAATETDRLAPDINKLSLSQREEAAAKEIEALYKNSSYNYAVDWIPAVAETALIIVLYVLISKFTPAGPLKQTLAGHYDDLSKWIYLFVLVAASIAPGFVGREVSETKNGWIVLLISAIVSGGLSVFIGIVASTAIVIAAITLHLCDTVYKITAPRFVKTEKVKEDTPQ